MRLYSIAYIYTVNGSLRSSASKISKGSLCTSSIYTTIVCDGIFTVTASCNNVAPVTNLCLGRATTRSHSSQLSKQKVAIET